MISLFKAPLMPQQIDLLWQELPADWQGTVRLLLLCLPQPPDSAALHMLHELAQKACGLQKHEYRILELPPETILAWSKLKSVFQPDFVFLFGLQPAALGIQAFMAFNFPNRFSDTVLILTSDAAAMAADKKLKNDLWIHDETDFHKAQIITRLFDEPQMEHHLPRPFGVFYNTERPCYEDVMAMQIEEAIAKGKGDLDRLLRGKETWEIAE